jgi:hypothetical protein
MARTRRSSRSDLDHAADSDGIDKPPHRGMSLGVEPCPDKQRPTLTVDRAETLVSTALGAVQTTATRTPADRDDCKTITDPLILIKGRKLGDDLASAGAGSHVTPT